MQVLLLLQIEMGYFSLFQKHSILFSSSSSFSTLCVTVVFTLLGSCSLLEEGEKEHTRLWLYLPECDTQVA